MRAVTTTPWTLVVSDERNLLAIYVDALSDEEPAQAEIIVHSPPLPSVRGDGTPGRGCSLELRLLSGREGARKSVFLSKSDDATEGRVASASDVLVLEDDPSRPGSKGLSYLADVRAAGSEPRTQPGRKPPG